MADLSKIERGNWMIYMPDNRYCTFVSRKDNVIVEGFDGRLAYFLPKTHAIGILKAFYHVDA